MDPGEGVIAMADDNGDDEPVDDNGDDDDFDITPDPNILIALTFNPLSWLDAICELVDNSIDSFGHALRLGEPVGNPLVELFISTGERGPSSFATTDLASTALGS